jgi:hypothetical protein
MKDELEFLDELKAQIMEQGYDERTAGHYAVLIGDTPVLDEHKNVLVHDGLKVVATLKPLKYFDVM